MILFLACGAPEAPAELDELTVYLYENHADDEAMAVGVQSLAIWLEANPDLEHYIIEGLERAARSTRSARSSS